MTTDRTEESAGPVKVRLPRSPLYWGKALWRYWRGNLGAQLERATEEERTLAFHTIYLLGRWSPRVVNTMILFLMMALSGSFAVGTDLRLGEFAALYAFSAILQGYAALLAITGAFVVFRFQMLDREIERGEGALSRLVEEAQNVGRDSFTPGVAEYSAAQVLVMLDDLEERGVDDSDFRVKFADETLLMLSKGLRARALHIPLGPGTDKVRFRGRFMKPLLLLTITIVLALAMLPFAQNLHGHPAQERGLVAFTGLIALWATVETGRFVWLSVQAREAEGPEAVNEIYEQRARRAREAALAAEEEDEQ